MLWQARGLLEAQLILNERDARNTRATLARVRETLSASATIQSARIGLSTALIERHRKAIAAIENDLASALSNYDQAKAGQFESLLADRQHDPGMTLIVARIARGMSQADLANRIGVREQQIQRYEAERYRSITLANYKRIAGALGVQLTTRISETNSPWLGESGSEILDYPDKEIRRVADYAKSKGWFDAVNDEGDKREALANFLEDASGRITEAAHLRTGMVPKDLASDLGLMAWRARVTKLAEGEIPKLRARFDPIDISWLGELVRLSTAADGPLKAKAMLRERGLLLVIEPQVPGLALDGAAIIVRGTPVIALTLRHDRIDNFWFTLLHELAHIFLHHRAGLFVGFFDDFESDDRDEIETEANEFAADTLIPNERWRLSPARISKTREPVLDFAKQLRVHPAIIFGRIRNERRNYRVLATELGQGGIRDQFL